METSFILLSLILVAAVFVPFFLLNAIGQKKKGAFKAQCRKKAKELHLDINEEELWGHFYIGMDIGRKKLLYIRRMETELKESLLDLSSVHGCEIAEKRKVIKRNNKQENLLEKLDLVIRVNKSREPRIFNFYDSGNNDQEFYEMPRIEKWKKLILAHSGSSSISTKAA